MSDARDYLNRLLGRSADTGKATAIPDVPHTDDRGLSAFLTAVKEWISTASGSVGGTTSSGKLVSWDDLIGNGLARTDINGRILPAASAIGATDYSPPPAPINLRASGALASILLEWDAPVYSGHSYTEIWASSTNTLGTAVLVGTSSGGLYAHPVGAGQSRYYWARFVSQADVQGAYNASAGVLGQTSDDPAQIISILTSHGAYTDTPFYYQATPTTVNGVQVPAGTYMRAAFIANGSIGNAQIGSLSGEKITANSISANKISVNNLSALSSDLGFVNAGSININNKFSVASDGTVNVKSGSTGARVESTNDCIKVYDSNGTLRVQLGNLSS